jgi:predicted HTH transcriptional regulator
MGDLIVNGIGAGMVSLVGYFYIKKGKIVFVSALISKFVEKNPKLFGSRKFSKSSPEAILDMIGKGEHKNLEFKSTLRTNLHTNQIDKKIEHSVLKTVSAYLNSQGGTLLVGVGDKGEILGVDRDAFPNNDKLNLHFTNLLKHHIGNEYLPFIRHELVSVDGKHLLKIDCSRSQKHVFLKSEGREEFYVRNGPASVKLSGGALIDYVNHNFKR